MFSYKCMVIGGAGFIGTELCFLLEKRFGKENVCIIDNFSNECGADVLIEYGFSILEVDIFEKHKLEEVIKKFNPEIVYYLSNKDCKNIDDVNENIICISNVSEMAVKYNFPLLFISGANVYGDLSNTYFEQQGCNESFRYNPKTFNGLSNCSCEMNLTTLGNFKGLKYSILRIPEVFSDKHSKSFKKNGWFSKLKNTSFDIGKNGASIIYSVECNEETRQWVHLSELCKAIDVIGDFLVLDYDYVKMSRNIFNVSGAEKINSMDLVNKLSLFNNLEKVKIKANMKREKSLVVDGGLISSCYAFEAKNKIKKIYEVDDGS